MTLTKTAARTVNSRIRALQRERRDWLAGCRMPWGTTWCHDRADEVGEQIRQLEASLVPQVQGALW